MTGADGDTISLSGKILEFKLHFYGDHDTASKKYKKNLTKVKAHQVEHIAPSLRPSIHVIAHSGVFLVASLINILRPKLCYASINSRPGIADYRIFS